MTKIPKLHTIAIKTYPKENTLENQRSSPKIIRKFRVAGVAGIQFGVDCRISNIVSRDESFM